MQRRFRYGYAHALEVCRQLEARDWLRIVEGGKCELSEKILLSTQDGSSPASDSTRTLPLLVPKGLWTRSGSTRTVMANCEPVFIAANGEQADKAIAAHNATLPVSSDTERLDKLESLCFMNRESEREIHFDFKGTLREAIDAAMRKQEANV